MIIPISVTSWRALHFLAGSSFLSGRGGHERQLTQPVSRLVDSETLILTCHSYTRCRIWLCKWVRLTLIWLFHHLAQLPTHFWQISISPSKTRQTVNPTHSTSKWDTLLLNVMCNNFWTPCRGKTPWGHHLAIEELAPRGAPSHTFPRIGRGGIKTQGTKLKEGTGPKEGTGTQEGPLEPSAGISLAQQQVPVPLLRRICYDSYISY